jgi:hypothetical protein
LFLPHITTDYSEACLNPLNAELNPICHLLALLGAHHILHVSRIRVKRNLGMTETCLYWKTLRSRGSKLQVTVRNEMSKRRTNFDLLLFLYSHVSVQFMTRGIASLTLSNFLYSFRRGRRCHDVRRLTVLYQVWLLSNKILRGF